MNDNSNETLNKILASIFYSNKGTNDYKIIKNTTRIPDMLILLHSTTSTIDIKYKIAEIIQNTFSTIRHYIEIFNRFTIDHTWNLYKILLHQYVLCLDSAYNDDNMLISNHNNNNNDDEKKEKYLGIITSILEIMISNVTCPYSVFEYMYSLFQPYLSKNKKDNVKRLTIKRFKEYFNLLSLLYGERYSKNIPYEYFYFSGEGEMTVSLIKDSSNVTEVITYDNSYTIFTWFKIGINKDDIKSIFSKSECHLICIEQANTSNITISLDLNHVLKSTSDPQMAIELEESRWYLLSFSWNKNTLGGIDTRIYLDGNIKSSQMVSLAQESLIQKISFFRNFIGEVTTILLFEGDKYEALFNIFCNKRFKYGIKSEKGVIMLNKTLNNEIYKKHDSHVIQQVGRIISKKEFPSIKDLKLIYMPNRHEEENELVINVKDSYCNAKIEMSFKYFNGIHIHQRHHKNISMIEGLYNLLPLAEMIGISGSPYNPYPLLDNILTQEIIDDFCYLLVVIKGNLSKKGSTEEIIHFIRFFSMFLEKIPSQFFKSKMFNYFQTLFIFKDLKIISKDQNEQSLFDEICLHIFLNKKIFFKFDKENQEKIWSVIDSCPKVYNRIPMLTICSFLLEIDKEKYVKYCCVDHARIFNIFTAETKDSDIPLTNILSEISCMQNTLIGIIKEQPSEIIMLYSLLLKEISPCLQLFIVNTLFTLFKIKQDKQILDLLCKDDFFINVTLFALSTALGDMKFELLNLLLQIIEKKNNFKFTIEQSIFLQNSLLPIYTMINIEDEREKEIDFIKAQYTFKTVDGDENNNIINDVSSSSIIRQDSQITNINNDSIINSFVFLQGNDENSKISEIPNKAQGIDSTIVYSDNELERLKEASFPQELNQDAKMLKPSRYQKITPNQRQEFLTKYLNEDKFNESLGKIFAFILSLLAYKPIGDDALNCLIKICPFIDLQNCYKLIKLSLIDVYFETMASSLSFSKWLIDTAFQAHITKDPQLKGAFKYTSSSNDLSSIIELDNFIKDSIALHTRICMIYIERLDDFLNWCNYYKKLYENDGQYTGSLHHFISNVFYNLLAELLCMNVFEDPRKSLISQQFIYCFSVLFEYLIILKIDSYFTRALTQSETFDSNSIKIPHYYSTIFECSMNDNERRLEEKWDNYILFQAIITKCFIIYNDKINYEKIYDSYAKYLIDSNVFLPQLEILIYQNHNQTNKRTVNDGISLLVILTNLMSTVINEIETEGDMNYWLRNYNEFLTFLIIASLTLNPLHNYYSIIQLKVRDTIAFGFCFLIQQCNNNKKIILTNKIIGVLRKLFGLVKDITVTITNAIESKNQKKIMKSRYNATSMKSECAIYQLFNSLIKINDKTLFQCYDLIHCSDQEMKEIFNKENFKHAMNNNPMLKDVVEKLFVFPNYCRERKEKIKAIIPRYVTYCSYQSSDSPSIRLDTNYIESSYFIAKDNIWKEAIYYRNKFHDCMELNKRNKQFQLIQLVNDYRKLKTRLFSFRGLWSSKELFYSKRNDMKYRILNHLTKEYSRPLLYPVIDYEYYLPEFSKFEKKKMFFKQDISLQHVDIDTCKYFNSPKEKEEIDTNKSPSKQHEQQSEEKKIEINKLKYNEETQSTNMLKRIYQSIFIPADNTNHCDYLTICNFIKSNLKYSINNQEHLKHETDMPVSSNLMKAAYHIRGLFCNDSEGIKFFAYEWSNNKINDDAYDEYKQYGNFFKTPQKKNNYYLHIPYNHIERLLKRKAFFKNSLIEVFTIDKKIYTFQLWSEKERNAILSNITNHFTKEIIFKANKESAYENIGHKFSNNNNKEIIESSTLSLNKKIDQWINWEISTFEFLMCINILANRSYNDLIQYHVFPWIVSDYCSNYHHFDLAIRDLSKPIGMIDCDEESKQRKNDFIRKYNTMVEDKKRRDEEETPFVFGTHFSTSMYITYYLMRLFPFAQLKIEMQGNSFDMPNRLFNSLEMSYHTVTTQNGDLREMIPELFFLPETFDNINDFNFGEVENEETHKMERIQSVKLPIWCNDNSYKFITKHRQILEGDEVSKSISSWIDLIFGAKQKSVTKDKLYNLYREETYDSYEEKFNAEKNKENKHILCRSAEFGVTPHQILFNKLSKRKTIEEVLPQYITNYRIKINDNCISLIERQDEDNIGLLIKAVPNENKMLLISNYRIVEMELNDKTINLERRVTYEYKDYYQLEDINIKMASATMKNHSPMIIVYNKGRCALRGGYFNGQLYAHYNININKLLYYYNQEDMSPIIVMIMDKEEKFVYCGTSSGIVHIYFISGKLCFIDLSLYKTIHDQKSAITAMHVNSCLNVFATAASDGYIMLYTTPKCKLFNSIKISESMNITYIFVSSTPLACIAYYDLNSLTWYCDSINGKRLAKLEIESAIINAKLFSDCYFMDYIIFLTETQEIGLINLPDLWFHIREEAFWNIIDFDVSNEKCCYYVLDENEGDYQITVMKHDSNGLREKSEEKID